MQRVFVDVDTQHDFCRPDGALFVSGAPAAAPACARLVARAVADGALLVGSVDSHAHDAWEFEGNGRLGPAGEDPRFPPHCVKGTPGWLKLPETLPPRFYFVPVVPDPEAAARIPARTQAVYFEKEVYSLFANPNAAPVLDALAPPGPVEFVVFGVATDYCVRAAALGLRDWIAARPDRAGSRVAVVSDAVAAVTAEGGAAALRELTAAGVALVSADAITG
ncbi:MAG: isochorismatase family protein [Deltaproteobacteria bacterium]|nr:isochorismatase family protein [Myxococcales bacterium]MDP3214887.1 isochorismatase family protein [Deltaproteobacteria bacterium]